jgi:hypothetical protein
MYINPDFLTKFLECTYRERYTVESHGDGYAIYFGRCAHKHGIKEADNE